MLLLWKWVAGMKSQGHPSYWDRRRMLLNRYHLITGNILNTQYPNYAAK